ncbi:hypothetical protein PIB30_044996 [Stylosanthes scabra]|uniref:Myb/SANT-like domain-containing protein n=1 Tax=Stylosanthes scabra TaxID=79078 RepID=A0ABU6XGX5_9FABA|nr:hypothetical protein [Stylosanthes scabra]
MRVSLSHCKNKVKRLKEKYQFVEDMVACSGFGWDGVKQCVVVDNKEILTAYMKERANGAVAMCRNDAEEEVQKDGDEEMDNEDMDMFNSYHDFRKDTKMMKELTDTLKYVFDQHGKHLDAFAQAMVNTCEEKKVDDKLSELDFTNDEIISVALKFATNPQLEKAFWSLGDDSLKSGFARAILHS